MKRLTQRKGDRAILPIERSAMNKDVIDIPRKIAIQSQKALQKLADYEDAEEEGRLVILPCKVGDTVYSISGMKIQEEVVSGIEYCTDYYCLWSNEDTWIGILGNCAYLTRDEAEYALEKMKGETK